MNKDQNNQGRRRTSSENSGRLSASRRVPSTSSRPASPDHPARRKEPHYPSSGRPSSSARSSSSKREYDNEEEEDVRGTSTALSSLVKAVIYIVFILVVSGMLSYFIITVGNDIFAFVKKDTEITLSIEEGTSVKELGTILEENGVIKYDWAFNAYAKLRDKNPTLVAGEYTVSPTLNYDQLLRVFAKATSTKVNTVIVVIPEGYTVDKIVDTLVNKYGLSSKEELYDVIENYDFNYWFVDQLESEIRPDRKHRLEGYLYPDTYYYYENASAVTIINKMLKNFDVKMKQTFKNCVAEGDTYIEKINNLCKERNMTFDQVVNLASIIQMETYHDIEYGTISSVINNRLKNPGYETGGLLGCDATLYYIFQDNPPEELTQEHLQVDDPYNTRKYKGLPPGPISNPTFLAINYALYPENTKYYYFVAKKDGYNLFARTESEHNKNKQIALSGEDND